MKLAIMQPYFLPYIGYFQLINAVDTFVVYDNIQYTKKGWINRNRFLRDQSDVVFTVPLKKDSDFLNVDQREIAESFNSTKLINQLRTAYRNAPYFSVAMPIIEGIIRHSETNLFRFIRHSIAMVCDYLRITSKTIHSSTIDIDHTLKAQNKVLAICEALGASTYINPIGGTSLYSKAAFTARGVNLQFLKSMPFEYSQFGEPFVPWLSIVDVVMFNKPETTCDYLNAGYSLIESN
jgi:hypothetical protein